MLLFSYVALALVECRALGLRISSCDVSTGQNAGNVLELYLVSRVQVAYMQRGGVKRVTVMLLFASAWCSEPAHIEGDGSTSIMSTRNGSNRSYPIA